MPAPAGSVGRGFSHDAVTQVSRAKADSPEGRRALAELCNAYYEPMAAFLRCELRGRDAARELTRDFFANMLESGAIAYAEQKRGVPSVSARCCETLF
jgi:RNA polymerase sigma-70 factor (ECF subfamily)